jgi:hypothetical protein
LLKQRIADEFQRQLKNCEHQKTALYTKIMHDTKVEFDIVLEMTKKTILQEEGDKCSEQLEAKDKLIKDCNDNARDGATNFQEREMQLTQEK